LTPSEKKIRRDRKKEREREKRRRGKKEVSPQRTSHIPTCQLKDGIIPLKARNNSQLLNSPFWFFFFTIFINNKTKMSLTHSVK
jgi:hypothetical protein